MDTVIIIPSRMGSSRYPGKPLKPVAGKMLMRRVWDIAKSVEGVDEVIIATEADEILEAAQGFGAKAVITPESCRNGTERALAAIDALGIEPRTIINLQGDAVLTPPWIVQDLVNEMKRDPDVQLATPAVRMTAEQVALLQASKDAGDVGGTTVTFNRNMDALYFSKRIIPLLRGEFPEPPVYRHIGMYGYRLDTLRRYLTLEQGQFEQAEQLEQLRALEHGIPIRVVLTDYKGRTHWAVDSPEDARIAEDIIAREGELV
ncbi:MAG: 3-deoxy-manno-octulosonate cytidylyltransferase [Alphaproteobacteria bacterium]